MYYNNSATVLKREVLINIAKLYWNNELLEKVDRIPIEMIPKNATTFRCCLYHDRAVIRYRVVSALGFSIQDETDELETLSHYTQSALQRETPADPHISFVDSACSACVTLNYFVTNGCRGCVARPCKMNCPKKAIDIVHNRAEIDSDKCVNCGLCMKVCPYHAIIRVPVPCEESCPVDAIKKDESGKERIDYDKCIFCGKCARACPFGAIMVSSQILDVLKHLKSGRKIAALVAPAVIAHFPSEIENMLGAVKELGFTSVYEVAKGADMTSSHEASEFVERMEHGAKFMTSSCCPAYTNAVEKHIPELKPFVSDTKTPMQYTSDMVKELEPDAIQVFISPCIAKRKEVHDYKSVDYILTIEELGALFVALGVEVANAKPIEMKDIPAKESRGFPVISGVANAVKVAVGERWEVKPFVVDGLTRESIKQLRSYVKNGVDGNFIEVMACEGGCVAGTSVISNPKLAARKIERLTKDNK